MIGFYSAGAMGQGGGGGGDPHFSSVVLLAHMDGTDGSTTFTDSSSYARTITPAGNAQIDTAQSMFGGASALFDGAGDYLRCAASADFQLFVGNFTAEGWWRKPSNAGNQCLIEFGSSNANRLNLSIASGNIGIYRTVGVNSGAIVAVAAPVVDTWHAWCIEKVGTAIYLRIDGVTVGSGTPTGGYPSGNLTCDIGRSVYGGGSDYSGWQDEIRITKGVARYGGDYTPSGPFPNF